MINDSFRGRLDIPGIDFPEMFDAGDLVFMDPRFIHGVSIYPRKKCRKVVVLTM